MAKKDEGPDRRREVLGAWCGVSFSFVKRKRQEQKRQKLVVLGGYEGIRPQLMLKLLKLFFFVMIDVCFGFHGCMA